MFVDIVSDVDVDHCLGLILMKYHLGDINFGIACCGMIEHYMQWNNFGSFQSLSEAATGLYLPDNKLALEVSICRML